MIINVIEEGFTKEFPFKIASNIFYNDENYESHIHKFYEFFMVLEGELIHTKNGEEMSLRRRSICFMNPEDEHELHNSRKNDKVRIVNCSFTKNFLADTERILQNDVQNTPESWSSTISNIPSPIWQCLIDKANLIQFHRADYPSQVLCSLFRSLCMNVLLLIAENIGTGDKDIPGWLIKAREKMQIEANFIAGLPKFIELSGRSQEHLTRSMKKYYAETPTAFINQLRVRKAAQSLLYSRDDIWDIMDECGFNNYAYFIKCFKKGFGMSPSQYIKVNRRIFSLK